MTALQKLLLLPCLSPLLAALVVGTLNGGQPSSLRLLTWRSPQLPIGAWIALSTSGASLVTALAALSASSATGPLRRQVHRPMGWTEPEQQAWNPAADREQQVSHHQHVAAESQQPMPWPDRDIRDPAPTVAVPFRVVKRGTTTRKKVATASPSAATDQGQPSNSPVDAVDDWNQPLNDDW